MASSSDFRPEARPNPYFQYFCGEVVFRHELPFDRSSLTRWRQRLGEEQIAALLQESLLTLWLSTEKMWRVTRISTIAARRAANAAIRQAKAAEDALTQLEKPYIFVFGVKQIFQDQSTNDFFVTYTVANFGKLPPAIIEGSTIVASPQARSSCRRT